MGGENKSAAIRVPFQERTARGGRLFGITTEATTPLRFRRLYWVVHHVTSQDRFFSSAFDVEPLINY